LVRSVLANYSETLFSQISKAFPEVIDFVVKVKFSAVLVALSASARVLNLTGIIVIHGRVLLAAVKSG